MPAAVAAVLPQAIPAAPPPVAPPDYISLVQAQLLRARRYPGDARARGEEGTVLIRFVLAVNGSVVSARVARSSGAASLDAAGLEMVARAAPFPPLPEALRPMPLTLAVPVAFSLRDR